MKKGPKSKSSRVHIDIDMSKVGKAIADMLIFDLDKSILKPTKTDYVLGTAFEVLKNVVEFLNEAVSNPQIGFPLLCDFIDASEFAKLKDTSFDMMADMIEKALLEKRTLN